MNEDQITDYIYESKLYLENVYSEIEHIDNLTYEDLNSFSRFSSIKYLKLQLIKTLGDEPLRKRRLEVLMKDYEVVFNTDLISKLTTKKRTLSFIVEKLERLRFSYFGNDDDIDGNSLVFIGDKRQLEHFKKVVNLLIPNELVRENGELSYSFEDSFHWHLKLKTKNLKLIRDALNLSQIIEEIVLGSKEYEDDKYIENQPIDYFNIFESIAVDCYNIIKDSGNVHQIVEYLYPLGYYQLIRIKYSELLNEFVVIYNYYNLKCKAIGVNKIRNEIYEIIDEIKGEYLNLYKSIYENNSHILIDDNFANSTISMWKELSSVNLYEYLLENIFKKDVTQQLPTAEVVKEEKRRPHKEQIILLDKLGFLDLPIIQKLTGEQKGILFGRLLGFSIDNTGDYISHIGHKGTDLNPYNVKKENYEKNVIEFLQSLGIDNQ